MDVDEEPPFHRSAFAYFVLTCRVERKKKRLKTTDLFSDFSKNCADRWKLMSMEEKQRYQQLSENGKKKPDRNNTPAGDAENGINGPTVHKRLSGFFWFLNEDFPRVKESLSVLTVGDAVRECKQRWNEQPQDTQVKCEAFARVKYKWIKFLCREEKLSLQQLSENDKKSYESDMLIYEPVKVAENGPNVPGAMRLSGYFWFVNEEFPKLRKSLPNTTVYPALKECKRLWKEMSQDTRAKYKALAIDKDNCIKVLDGNSPESEVASDMQTQFTEEPAKNREPTKKALSSLFWFATDELPKVIESFPNSTVEDILNELTRIWNEQSQDTKAKYRTVAKDRAKYIKLFENWPFFEPSPQEQPSSSMQYGMPQKADMQLKELTFNAGQLIKMNAILTHNMFFGNKVTTLPVNPSKQVLQQRQGMLQQGQPSTSRQMHTPLQQLAMPRNQLEIKNFKLMNPNNVPTSHLSFENKVTTLPVNPPKQVLQQTQEMLQQGQPSTSRQMHTPPQQLAMPRNQLQIKNYKLMNLNNIPANHLINVMNTNSLSVNPPQQVVQRRQQMLQQGQPSTSRQMQTPPQQLAMPLNQLTTNASTSIMLNIVPQNNLGFVINHKPMPVNPPQPVVQQGQPSTSGEMNAPPQQLDKPLNQPPTNAATSLKLNTVPKNNLASVNIPKPLPVDVQKKVVLQGKRLPRNTFMHVNQLTSNITKLMKLNTYFQTHLQHMVSFCNSIPRKIPENLPDGGTVTETDGGEIGNVQPAYTNMTAPNSKLTSPPTAEESAESQASEIFNKELVQFVVKEKLKETGSRFTSVVELCKEILNYQASRPRPFKMKDDEMVCKICLEKQMDTAFEPCGHLSTCQECAQSVLVCPICRTVIETKLRIYFS